MSNRINANQIKAELDSVIADADNTEPQLAQKLRQLSRWIKVISNPTDHQQSKSVRRKTK